MAREITVIVKVVVEGLHWWPDAFDDVDFLRERHRHLFHIEARAVVQHTDREIEIIQLGREIKAHVAQRYGEPAEFGRKSCEDIADELVTLFNLQCCTVLEDGENGAMVKVVES